MNIDLRGAFWTPSATILGSASKVYDRILRSIFANGEQGFAYDPNDLTTLFQDAAGTVPVTGAGQPVGLVLDKSKGLVLGINTNVMSQWGSTIGFTYTAPNLILSNTSGGTQYPQRPILAVGKWYKVQVTCSSAVGNIKFSNQGGSTQSPVLTVGTITAYILAADANLVWSLPNNSSATITAFTAQELTGNHAYQTVSASRPILRQSSTLGTELVVNGGFSVGLANWVQQGTAVSSVSAGVLSITAQGSTSGVYQDITTVVGRTYALDFSSTGNLLVQLYANSGFAPSIPNSNTPRMTFVATSSVTRLYAYCNGSDAGTIDNISLKHVTGFSTDQNYLAFDGADDFLQTNNIDFTATDKVSLFAGIRKLSDAATGVVFELGVGLDKAKFVLFAPASLGVNKYNFRSYGTLGDSTGTANLGQAVFNAPHSAVLTAKGQISADLCSLTVNASLTVHALSPEQGSGNYSNAPLYIGRRAGTSLPFNGHLYSLIGISRLTTDSETIALEKAIAKQTGVTLNV